MVQYIVNESRASRNKARMKSIFKRTDPNFFMRISRQKSQILPKPTAFLTFSYFSAAILFE